MSHAPTSLPLLAFREPSRRCTDVVARYDAGSVAVCKAAGEVALHFGTTSGVVVVFMRLDDFVQQCRGPRDHNGQPLPPVRSVSLEDADRDWNAPEHDSEEPPAPPVPVAPPTPTPKRRGRRPDSMKRPITKPGGHLL